jgi:hypothetical protein
MLVRGHQAAKNMLPSACPESFQSCESQVDNQASHSFLFLSIPPACDCLIANQLLAFSCLLSVAVDWFTATLAPAGRL